MYSTITQSQAQQTLIPITFPSGTVLVPASFIANDEATLYDFNATILHLLGLNHERLTHYFNGTERRLTDVHGHVIKDILA
jgi:hypothetical protein